MFKHDERRNLVVAATLALILLPCLVASGQISNSRLIDAARTQDAAAVRGLLKQKSDVNGRSSDGSTALLWAAHWSDVEMAELLLDAGARADAVNDFGVSPLSEACLNGNAALVRLLLRNGANPNLAIATGETPVMTCARTGSADAVRALIESGADVNTKEPSQSQTALMWATAEKHPDVVKVLIDAGGDVQARTKQGFSAIHFAARVGDLKSLALYLAAGVDIDFPTRVNSGDAAIAGYTPLLIATLRAQVDAALYLLDRGADPNILSAGFTPLHWASTTWEGFASNPVYGFSDPMSGIPDRQAKLRLVKALLAHGANVNERMTRRQPNFATGYTDAVGATPLLLASSVQDVEMMRILLEAGADPNIKTATNATTIIAATGLNHGIGESFVTEAEATAAVNLLLSLGVDPKGETTFGENALFGPAYRGWNTLLEQLARLGVNVNAVSKAGTTPWRAANGQGDRLGGVLYNKEGADLLVKYGANPQLGVACEAQNRCRELRVPAAPAAPAANAARKQQ
jgi:ankyrin repeat protein